MFAFVPEECGIATLPHRAEKLFKDRIGRAGETKVGDSRDSDSLSFAVLFDFLGAHRHKVLNAFLFKNGTELQYPSIGYPYCVPMLVHVEMGGLEPPSKHRTERLSTRLVFLWLSAGSCRMTGYSGLILWGLAGFKGVLPSIRFE